jgi:carbon storage regulator CsrA
MLVLSRKSGECVQIGDLIEVKVLEVSGGRVKLGFSAPPNVAIQRAEIRGSNPRPLAAWHPCLAVGELCAP